MILSELNVLLLLCEAAAEIFVMRLGNVQPLPKKSSLALGGFRLVLLIWLLKLKMQTLLSRESPNCIRAVALMLQSSPLQRSGLRPCVVNVDCWEPRLGTGHGG